MDAERCATRYLIKRAVPDLDNVCGGTEHPVPRAFAIGAAAAAAGDRLGMFARALAANTLHAHKPGPYARLVDLSRNALAVALGRTGDDIRPQSRRRRGYVAQHNGTSLERGKLG